MSSPVNLPPQLPKNSSSALVYGGLAKLWSKTGWRVAIPVLLSFLAIVLSRDAYRAYRYGSSMRPIAFFLGTVGLAAFGFLWQIPVIQVARYRSIDPTNDKSKFDAVNEARKTLSQILAGLFVFLTVMASLQTLKLSTEGQLTDRFTKAVEQVGAADKNGCPNVAVRMGGIYSLESLSRTRLDYHRVIIEFLVSYVRDNAPVVPTAIDANCPLNNRIRADINAVLMVMGRRGGDDSSMEDAYLPEKLNLQDSDLSGAWFAGGYYRNALFNRSNLRGANLLRSHLEVPKCALLIWKKLF